MRWLGRYLIGTDEFEIEPWRPLRPREYGIEFTEHEENLIDAASEGRERFVWSPHWRTLTAHSRAYWAMM